MIQVQPESGNLIKLLAQGSNGALNLAKSILTNPVLINPPAGLPYSYENQSMMPFFVPLEVVSHKQHMDAEISENLIICKTQKQHITDNIAPGSWTWTLSGYIPGLQNLEPTNLFTPFVTMNTNFLRRAAAKGYLLVFKDMDSSIYTNVVIKSLDIDTQKDCRNKTPFTMTLKAINTLDEISVDLSDSARFASTTPGTILGDALKIGVTTSAQLTAKGIEALTFAF